MSEPADPIKNEEYWESKALPGFGAALRGWIGALKEYRSQVPDDHPWVYLERAAIGFLSAGVWRSGGVGLEEWHTDKTKERVVKPGRCDLWAFQEGRYDYHIEAKFTWSNPMESSNKRRKAIELVLKQAVEDVVMLTCDPPKKLAIVFVAPFYRAAFPQPDEEHLTGWLRDLYRIDRAAIAWYLPRTEVLSGRGSDTFPGIVLLAQKSE